MHKSKHEAPGKWSAGAHIEVSKVDPLALVIRPSHPASGILEHILLIKVIIQLVPC